MPSITLGQLCWTFEEFQQESTQKV